MSETLHRERFASLSHWIGVEACWQLKTEDPFECLVTLPPELLRTHAYFLGATGSGKTTLIHHLIAQDIELGHSFCIIDMRGDLVAAALELLADRIDPKLVRIFDLREQQHISGFNPLYGSGESYFRALSVLEIIANESESWGVQLGETLRNALLLLSEAGEPLTHLERLFFRPAIPRRLPRRGGVRVPDCFLATLRGIRD